MAISSIVGILWLVAPTGPLRIGWLTLTTRGEPSNKGYGTGATESRQFGPSVSIEVLRIIIECCGLYREMCS